MEFLNEIDLGKTLIAILGFILILGIIIGIIFIIRFFINKKKKSDREKGSELISKINQSVGNISTGKDIFKMKDALEQEAHIFTDIQKEQEQNRAVFLGQQQQFLGEKESFLREKSEIEQKRLALLTIEHQLELKQKELETFEQTKTAEFAKREEEIKQKETSLLATETKMNSDLEILKTQQDENHKKELELNVLSTSLGEKEKELEAAKARLEIDNENLTQREDALNNNMNTFNNYQADFARKVNQQINEIATLRIENERKYTEQLKAIDDYKEKETKLIEYNRMRIQNEIKKSNEQISYNKELLKKSIVKSKNPNASGIIFGAKRNAFFDFLFGTGDTVELVEPPKKTKKNTKEKD